MSEFDTFKTKTERDEIDLEDEPPQRVTTEAMLSESTTIALKYLS